MNKVLVPSILTSLFISTGAFADVVSTKEPVRADGRFDESAWAQAIWDDGCAVLVDKGTVHVAIKDVKKGADVCLSPTGGTFDFYRFGVDAGGRFFAAFYSEDGAIQPEPYHPEWTKAVGKDGLEMSIPLSAFFLTRNGAWKQDWRIGFARARAVETAPDPKAFAKVGGFPVRPIADDFETQTVWPTMDGMVGGKIVGRLKVTVRAGLSGKYELSTSVSDKATKLSLPSHRLTVETPCAFPSNGLYLVRIAFRDLKYGGVYVRNCPIRVAFEPLAVRLTTPSYRNSFYPGQDASRVEGDLTVFTGEPAEVSLDGPGFARQVKRIDARDAKFSFDTKGFRDGEALLTVKTATAEKTVRIRKLPPTGRQMVWVENGHLVVNGKPVLRRNLYSLFYRGGEKLDTYYKTHTAEFHVTPEFENIVDVSPWRVTPMLTERERCRDVKPCAGYLSAIDKIIDANRDKDFGVYYICDEPECCGISPVYLRYVYEHVAARDPYHPITMATRGGKAFIECADWVETHPYLSARIGPNGERRYGTHLNRMGDYLDAFEAWDRPEKVVGYLPTCFAYRWASSAEDYPTFDEYLAMTWGAMMRGGKSLWPYAYHDLADRPSIYRGTQYVFESFEALSDLVLMGKRTTFAKSSECEGTLYELGDEKMFVAVNFMPTNVVINPVGVTGRFREFRGARKFETGKIFGRAMKPFVLKPLETVVATTKDHDAGLKPLADVVREVAEAEHARQTRDNQLLERQDDLVLDTNLDGNCNGGIYKLVDGMYDQFARGKQWQTNSYLTLSFPKFTPTFRYLRLHGCGLIHQAKISVRQRGEWKRLEPVASRGPEYFREYDFGKPVSTVRLRLDFPGKSGQRNRVEIYEIELPRVPGVASDAARKAAKPAEDVGVSYRRGPFSSDERTSFAATANAKSRWVVFDVAGFADKPGRGYRAWNMDLRTPISDMLCRTVTHPQPGLYTIRLAEPLPEKTESVRIGFYHYGITASYNSIAVMEEPANRVELACTSKEGKTGSGDVLKVRVVLADPCEEVAAEFLRAAGTGDLLPFRVNGTSALNLRPLDKTGCVWGAEVKVDTCELAYRREVFVRVQPLGSVFRRPVLSTFPTIFDPKRK